MDENIDRFFKAFKWGLAAGLSNYEIAVNAGLRYPHETRYRSEIIKELRQIFEAKRKLNRERERASVFKE